MPNDQPPKALAIVGCGGVGTWAAITAAHVHRGNPGTLSRLGLFDADMLEDRNLGRVPLAQWGHGYKKVDALADFLAYNTTRDASPPIYKHPISITAANISVALADYDTIICCTDDVTSQRTIKLWCVENNKRYQRAGYDGDTINVCAQLPLTFDAAAEAQDAGYHGTPEVYHAMIAGALAVYSVLRAPITVMGEIAKLAIAGASFVPAPVAEALVEDQWRDKAENEGWHDSNECEIPDGYHSYDDCNYDDYVYVGGSSRETVENLPDSVIDYVIERRHECRTTATIVADDPEDTATELKAYHDNNHNTSNLRTWCPWCHAPTE